MKKAIAKLLTFVMVLMAVLTMAGCGSKKDEAPKEEAVTEEKAEEPAAEETVEEEPAAEETVEEEPVEERVFDSLIFDEIAKTANWRLFLCQI